MSTILLTGGTGFLGSYLLRDLLREGRAVAVLVRPRQEHTAEERVQGLLARFREEGTELPGPLRVLPGDLSAPDLGLSAEDRAWIAEHCDRVLHCAADLTFLARGGEPYRTNVDGTRYILRLCEEAGIRDFHLVSSAYVCGLREGRILESELEAGQVFGNDYERSKYMGEKLVHEASFLERKRIYRPSTIVGDSTTGFSNSEDGLYALLKVAELFATRDATETLDALGIEAHDRLNLVPVDWVSAVIVHLLDAPSRDATHTYHVTSPEPTPTGEIFEAVISADFLPSPAPQGALSAALRTYRPYLRDHPAFDSSHTSRDAPHLPCPRFTRARLEMLAKFVSAMPSAGGPRGGVALALNVVGPEGAILDVSGPGPAQHIGEEVFDDAAVRATCAARTFHRLSSGDLTVHEAVHSGLLALEGPTRELEQALPLLDAYLESARGAPESRRVGVDA